jgi:hypothetical protein
MSGRATTGEPGELRTGCVIRFPYLWVREAEFIAAPAVLTDSVRWTSLPRDQIFQMLIWQP